MIPYLSQELIQTIVRPNEPASKPLEQQSGPPRGGSRANDPGAAELAREISQQRLAFIAVARLKHWFASVIPLSIKSVK
jgi:hypothetical protein